MGFRSKNAPEVGDRMVHGARGVLESSEEAARAGKAKARE